MPRYVDPRKVEKYFQWRTRGATMAFAAREAQIGYATVRRLEQGDGPANRGRSFYDKAATHEARSVGPPVPRAKLRPEAQKALEDFAYFQRRYLGHVATPWQAEAAALVVEKLASPDKEFVLLNAPPSVGKALDVGTSVLTPTGWETIAGLAVGDLVYGGDGRPCEVVAKSPVFYGHACYEVKSDDGATVIADAGHLWPVRLHGYGRYKAFRADKAGHGPRRQSEDGVHVHTTELLARPRSKRPALAMAPPFFAAAPWGLPIDPYVLGLWLGDGSTDGARISAGDPDAKFLRAAFEAEGYRTVDGTRQYFGVRGGLYGQLRQAGLLGHKHVPLAYLRAGAEDRLALLQGLVDSDGYVGPGGQVEFTNTNAELAVAVQFLVRSLGHKAFLSRGRATYQGRDCGPKYRVTFRMAGAARLPRKALRCVDAAKKPYRYLTVTPVETRPVQCITVDSPDSTYLAGEGLLVTHNSTTFTLDIPAWLIARDRAIRGATFSNSQASANRYVMRLKRLLERTVPVLGDPEEIEKGLALDATATMADDFGYFRPAQRGDRWAREEFVVAQHSDIPIDEKESTWTAFGFDASYIGMRLDVLIADDVVDKRNIKTLEAVNKQREDWDDVAERRIDPGGLLLLQGQRLGPYDLYRYCADKYQAPEDDPEADGYYTPDGDDRRPLYHHIVFKAHYPDRCRGEHKLGSPPYPQGCLLDPRRLTWREVATARRNNPAMYSVVLQQEDTDPRDVLVNPVWVRGGTDPETGTQHPGCWDKGRDVAELPAGLHGDLLSYATVDPSAAKWWSAQWWVCRVVDFVPQERYLMDHHRARMQAPDLLDWQNAAQEFSGLMESWQDRSVRLSLPISRWVVERNGCQRYLLQYEHVWRWCAKWKTEIVPHDTERNKADPELGVEQLLPGLYRWGLVRLPAKGNLTQHSPAAGGSGWVASMKLVEEVTTYPHGLTNDCVMAQWFGEFWLPRMVGDGRRLPRLRRPAFLRATDTYAWAAKALWGKEKVNA